jgi:hypothetical protein
VSRSWKGNKEVHFWWESPVAAALLLALMFWVWLFL